MGFCNVTVQYKGQSKELPIYVMKNEGPTLFGREWLESIRLDWPLLQSGTSNTVPALEEVLSKHALRVFSESGTTTKKTILFFLWISKVC